MSSFDREYILKFILLFLLDLALSQFAGALFLGGTAPAVFYLPSAIGLVALFLWGYGYWPAIALATFASSLINGAIPLNAAGISVAYTLQALAGAYLLKKYDFQPLLGRLQDIFTFAAIAVGVAAVAPTIGFAVASFSHEFFGTNLPALSWLNWWIGELFSMMIFGPFFMRWFAYPHMTPRTRQEWFEAAATITVACAIAWILFWTPYSTIVGTSLIYLLFVPFFWIALRVGPRFMTLALVLLTLIALIGAPLGVHPPSNSMTTLGERILSIELFMLFVTFVFLTLTAAAEERKDATKTLRRHVDELEYALARIRTEDQAKSEFLATLAHELRNPLSPIISSLELIDQNIAKGSILLENQPHIKSIKTHVYIITKLLDDLLDITRITRKKFKLNKTTIELGGLIEQSVETVSAFFTERTHRLVWSPPQEPLWIDADPLRLQQVIVNILYNAGKYTDPGGVIELGTRVKGQKIEIRVKDNGIGIAPEMIKNIFEPFVQIPNESKIGTGLGIGLSLTKRLIELHGGTVHAQSQGLGKGSEFVVSLPLPQVAQLPMPIGEVFSFAKKSSVRPKSILLVDDNEPAAETLGTLLKGQGYQVDTAFNGAQALEATKRQQPDVVILDIGLPDMDGYSVARKLRQEEARPPVLIALTGYGQGDDKRKARDAGFAYHLTKPVGIADIEAVFRKISFQQ